VSHVTREATTIVHRDLFEVKHVPNGTLVEWYDDPAGFVVGPVEIDDIVEHYGPVCAHCLIKDLPEIVRGMRVALREGSAAVFDDGRWFAVDFEEKER
jgi:hypothetical protein